jgi:hypothetical protein
LDANAKITLIAGLKWNFSRRENAVVSSVDQHAVIDISRVYGYARKGA